MLLLIGAGFLSYALLSKPVPPPPPEVASNPFLLEGRSIYVARCATCHGLEGRGDGPIASHLMGPPVGNLIDANWKHGDKPEQVMSVISRGVDGTRMAGWRSVLEHSEIRAVTAYIFYLARRPIPAELTEPGKADQGPS
jgi:mono/diheme cytochrome c family protein